MNSYNPRTARIPALHSTAGEAPPAAGMIRAAKSETEGLKGAYPGDKPVNRADPIGAHPVLRMRIALKVLIAVG